MRLLLKSKPTGSSPRLRGTPRRDLLPALPGRFIPAPAGNTSAPAFPSRCPAVHPRACGEHDYKATNNTLIGGSSPRLRGTPEPRPGPSVWARFIPAPAGNTCGAIGTYLARPVHPRACGEHATPCSSSDQACGSSPRLRGTLGVRAHRIGQVRFIPAPAGNTRAAGPSWTRRPVHPRACGEHTSSIRSAASSSGSSPRLRGTRSVPPGRRPPLRFIPAPAGNTRPRPRWRIPPPVHPRACGEHALPVFLVFMGAGSSPRLRGTPQHPGAGGAGSRFIPAPAGNTCLQGMRESIQTVHPRACGEHASRMPSPIFRAGSSPRLRGTRPRPGGGAGHQRFIPTPAGNTPRSRRGAGRRPVHPHACGEHTPQGREVMRRCGSSPRLRGTQLALALPGLRRRFIPTPAGNTPIGRRSPIQCTVHPHACGEHWVGDIVDPSFNGSSPRLRGTRDVAHELLRVARFIPTPAGNTPVHVAARRGAPVHPHACGEHRCVATMGSSWFGSSPRLRGTRGRARPQERRLRFIPTPAGNTLCSRS